MPSLNWLQAFDLGHPASFLTPMPPLAGVTYRDRTFVGDLDVGLGTFGPPAVTCSAAAPSGG